MDSIYGKYNNMCELALSGDDELLLLNKFRDCVKYSGSIF